MKPSKQSLINHVLGVAIFIFGAIIAVTQNKPEVAGIALAGTAILWIMGIERDIYHRTDEK